MMIFRQLSTFALWIGLASASSSSPMTVWTMDKWCQQQQKRYEEVTEPLLEALPASAHDFLQILNLPTIHPHCLNATIRHNYEMPGVPAMGPLQSHEGHLETAWDLVVTLAMRTLPSLAAMVELWLRLLAFLVAPLGVAHLLQTYYAMVSSTSSSATADKLAENQSNGRRLPVICGLTVASCIVLSTDTLYVLEYGPTYGLSLLAVALGASYLISTHLPRHSVERRNVRMVLIAMVSLLLLLTLDYSSEDNRFTVKLGDSDEACHIKEGLYYDQSNRRAQRLVDNWSPSFYKYDDDFPKGVATPWMPTGDARTGLPFLLHFVAQPPSYIRLWLNVPDSNHESSTLPLSNGEVVAIDASFPTEGHNHSRPVYLVLHGLSGGSQEEYIKDFVLRRNAEGSTVLVMIARGLMDLPIRGWNLFHGARTTDVHVAATVLRSALDELHQRHQQPWDESFDQLPPLSQRPTLVGVGYSMGGIVMANYVSRTGPDCPLDVAISVSGGLDMRYEANFTRAQRLWQPILTQELRNTFVVGKWGERVNMRLTPSEMKHMLRAYHITDIDRTAIVAYNQFRNLDHYYSDMSALGDTPVELHHGYNHSSAEGASSSTTHPSKLKRLQTLSIPLLVVHALDDPLISWRTVAANQGLLHPYQLTKWVPHGNLFVLLTKRGGHVGWPLGVNPTWHKWKWMNDVVMSFVQAFVDSSETTPPSVNAINVDAVSI